MPKTIFKNFFDQVFFEQLLYYSFNIFVLFDRSTIFEYCIDYIRKYIAIKIVIILYNKYRLIFEMFFFFIIEFDIFD